MWHGLSENSGESGASVDRRFKPICRQMYQQQSGSERKQGLQQQQQQRGNKGSTGIDWVNSVH